jgi:hypothetical protein
MKDLSCTKARLRRMTLVGAGSLAKAVGQLINQGDLHDAFASKPAPQLEAWVSMVEKGLLGTAQALPMLEADEDEAQLLGDLRLRGQMLGQGFGRRVDDVWQGGEY